MLDERPIEYFDGCYRFLSNFWPVTLDFEGLTFLSVENAFQAAKCLDISARHVFTSCTPAEAKRLGKLVPLRNDWFAVRLNVMRLLLQRKFAPAGDLAVRLDRTGTRELIEGNQWGDTYWGVCRGRGQNHLGRILMDIRSENRGFR